MGRVGAKLLSTEDSEYGRVEIYAQWQTNSLGAYIPQAGRDAGKQLTLAGQIPVTLIRIPPLVHRAIEGRAALHANSRERTGQCEPRQLVDIRRESKITREGWII